MPSNNNKEIWIEVFSTGELTDMSGNTKNWTTDDLDTIVNTYNEKVGESESYEAPVVKGHPATDDPAFGWVEKLKREGDIILAKLKNLASEFVEEVKDRKYKKVSVALYPDLMLRHVGFLGAVQPAVKGLEPVKFADEAKYQYEFEDSINVPPAGAQTVEQLKAEQKARSDKYGIGVKDKIGYVEKPAAYKDIPEEGFADPVNFLYPIHDKANVIATMKTFSPWGNDYSDIERQVMLAKIIAAAEKLGVEFAQDKMYFAEFSMPIKLNDKLKREKPQLYKEHTTSDFGDPVHYRFPLKSASEVRASMAIFNRENVKSQYADTEKQFIASRILQAAMSLAIKPKGESWSYVDVPVDQLTKQQLIDIVNTKIESKSNSPNNLKEFSSMENEKIQAFIDSLVTKVSEQISEEAATQVRSICDELVPQMFPEQAAGEQTSQATPPEGGVQANDKTESAEIVRLRQEIEAMKTKERMHEHNEYAESQVADDRIDPAQKPYVVKLLEFAHGKPSLEFAENGKTTQVEGTKLVKQFVESFEKRGKLREFATRNNASDASQPQAFAIPKGAANVDEQRAELHQEVLKFMESEKKNNNTVTYEQALREVSSR